MTIEEHIENLKAIASDMPSDKCSDWIESLMAGVKALEQEPCTDAISRQVVLDAIEDSDKNKDFTYFINKNAAKCFKRIIRDLPLVIPTEKVGYWILTRQVEFIYSDYFKYRGTSTTYNISCSNCGKGYHNVDLPYNGKTYKGTPYCPWCNAKILGVKMGEEE